MDLWDSSSFCNTLQAWYNVVKTSVISQRWYFRDHVNQKIHPRSIGLSLWVGLLKEVHRFLESSLAGQVILYRHLQHGPAWRLYWKRFSAKCKCDQAIWTSAMNSIIIKKCAVLYLPILFNQILRVHLETLSPKTPTRVTRTHFRSSSSQSIPLPSAHVNLEESTPAKLFANLYTYLSVSRGFRI